MLTKSGAYWTIGGKLVVAFIDLKGIQRPRSGKQ